MVKKVAFFTVESMFLFHRLMGQVRLMNVSCGMTVFNPAICNFSGSYGQR